MILGMLASSKDWIAVPMIKLGEHQKIHEQLGVPGPLAAYEDLSLIHI